MGWDVPQDARERILQRLSWVVNKKSGARTREVIAAARVLANADLRQQEIDLARQLADAANNKAGTLTELVGDAEKRAQEFDQQRSVSIHAPEGATPGSYHEGTPDGAISAES
jgi:hypothetical protein